MHQVLKRRDSEEVLDSPRQGKRTKVASSKLKDYAVDGHTGEPEGANAGDVAGSSFPVY